MSDEQIKHMVNRFLQWRLPADFYPDAGISFNREVNGAPRPKEWWPVGTNLLNATQAEAMIRYVIDGLATPQSKEGE